MSDNFGVMRCLRCKGTLERSGKEPYRHVCPDCGQHYFFEIRLTPVEAPRSLLEEGSAERRSGAE